MSLRDVSTEKMVQISAAWIDPKRHRKTLDGLPLVAGLLPKIDEAHRGLLAVQFTSTGAGNADLAGIQEKQAKLDVRHDRKMRGTFGLLAALADLADDPEEAQRYLDLRGLLLPDGLSGIIKSYAEEAGAAKLLNARLDEGSRKLLAKIQVPGGKLSDVVGTWIKDAEELGALEEKKGALMKQVGAGYVKRADVIKARSQWTRVARALESNLLLSEVPEETIEAILGPMYEAEAKALRKRSAAGKGEDQPKAPVDTVREGGKGGGK